MPFPSSVKALSDSAQSSSGWQQLQSDDFHCSLTGNVLCGVCCVFHVSKSQSASIRWLLVQTVPDCVRLCILHTFQALHFSKFLLLSVNIISSTDIENDQFLNLPSACWCSYDLIIFPAPFCICDGMLFHKQLCLCEISMGTWQLWQWQNKSYKYWWVYLPIMQEWVQGFNLPKSNRKKQFSDGVRVKCVFRFKYIVT